MRFRKSHEAFKRHRDAESNRERQAMTFERSRTTEKIRIDFESGHYTDIVSGNGCLQVTVVKQYEGYIRQAIEIGDSYDYLLEFGEGENVAEGRKALQLASENVGRHITIRKINGQNILRFHLFPDS